MEDELGMTNWTPQLNGEIYDGPLPDWVDYVVTGNAVGQDILRAGLYTSRHGAAMPCRRAVSQLQGRWLLAYEFLFLY